MGTPTAPALAGVGGPRGPGGPRSTSAPTGVGDDGSLAGTRSDTRPAPAAAARARNAATQTHPTGTVGRAARLWHARTPRPTGPAPRQGRARTRKARVSSRKASSTPPPRAGCPMCTPLGIPPSQWLERADRSKDHTSVGVAPSEPPPSFHTRRRRSKRASPSLTTSATLQVSLSLVHTRRRRSKRASPSFTTSAALQVSLSLVHTRRRRSK